MDKYGLQFTIPSVNVKCSSWYPSNPEYFVQIVSYVVPKHNEYVVETHYQEDKPKTVSNFQEIFKEKLKGCTIRLIKTLPDLTSIQLIDQFVFELDEKAENLNV